jgi:predicted RNase H-like nuclease (RuvC/YqgF family)
MKKFLILIAIPAFFACSDSEKKENAFKDSLSTANVTLKDELKNKEALLNTKEAAMTEFVVAFNDIQANLNEIKAKEKLISESSTGKDLKKINKDQIINDIQAIYNLLDKNKQKIASLNKKLKSSDIKINDLELAVNNLNFQLADKESEITSLKSKLENLNVDFANLKERYVEEQQELDVKNNALNTAYYVVGTKKDLMEKGVITKKGGFIGIGKVTELNTGLDEKYFIKVDITQTKEIQIHGDKVKLISVHPEGSYKLVEGTASIDKIVIIDADKFWSLSKYLIITSEKK